MERIIHFFQTNKITIIKLNHSMSTSETERNQYDAYMELGADGDSVKIVKKVALKNMLV